MEKENHNQIWEEIREIKENHLSHIREQITELKTDVAWLTKFQWLILSTAIASLLVNLLK